MSGSQSPAAVEQRTADFQQVIERTANEVRAARGPAAADAFAQRMEETAVRVSRGTPLRPSSDPAERLSDWEVADRFASSNLTPRDVAILTRTAASGAMKDSAAAQPVSQAQRDAARAQATTQASSSATEASQRAQQEAQRPARASL